LDTAKAAPRERFSPHPQELMEDHSYEQNLVNKLKPQGMKASLETMAWFEILKADLKKSRDERGYDKNKGYDENVIKSFQN
jgi:hypothetical protein